MRKLKIEIEGDTDTESAYETRKYRLYINGEFIYTSNGIMKVKQKINKIIESMCLEEEIK